MSSGWIDDYNRQADELGCLRHGETTMLGLPTRRYASMQPVLWRRGGWEVWTARRWGATALWAVYMWPVWAFVVLMALTVIVWG